MRLHQYINESPEKLQKAMDMWRKDLLKTGFIENDAVLQDIGMGKYRIVFQNHNVDPKWFQKKYLKGIKNVKVVNNMIFIDKVE